MADPTAFGVVCVQMLAFEYCIEAYRIQALVHRFISCLGYARNVSSANFRGRTGKIWMCAVACRAKGPAENFKVVKAGSQPSPRSDGQELCRRCLITDGRDMARVGCKDGVVASKDSRCSCTNNLSTSQRPGQRSTARFDRHLNSTSSPCRPSFLPSHCFDPHATL